jgi:D-lactate dehydrogenase
MKVAVFSTQEFDHFACQRLDHQGHQIQFFSSCIDESNVALAEGFDVVCLFCHDKVNQNIVAKLKQQDIKAILLRCAGFDLIDLKAAADAEMPVFRVPAYSPQAIAEHATALTLALNRKIHRAYSRSRDGDFSLRGMMGRNLSGMNVAVLGTGRIGVAFARIMKGFGCNVTGYNPHVHQDFLELGCEYGDYDCLAKGADLLSIHCPLTNSTRHLVDSEVLQGLADHAIVINTARGEIVNTAHLIDALQSGHLGGVGIDVYEKEAGKFWEHTDQSLITDDSLAKLVAFPNVIVTGHLGFLTQEACLEIWRTTFSNLNYVAGGCKGTSLNQVVLAEA